MTTSKHPKLIIIDYYDSLINQVDIYTEEQLAKHTDSDVVTEAISKEDSFNTNSSYKTEENPDDLDLESSNANLKKIVNYQPYSKEVKYTYPEEKAKHEPPPPPMTNVHQFLNKMREEMIGQIKRYQEKSLKYYETIKNELKVQKLESEEEILGRLFEREFSFLILEKTSHCKANKNSPFNMYLIVLDFYVNKHEILR